MSGSFAVQSKPTQMQFFGSGSDRKVTEFAGATETGQLGPGSYKCATNVRRKTLSFLQRERPSNLFQIVETNPGPQDYLPIKKTR